ncbi:MAG: acyl-CoA dehydrogenase family protein [Acidimicrobiia bacterium]|nr:acyl-CoA dehydrogenase family protein [Acidimicrobiia bacterium]
MTDLSDAELTERVDALLAEVDHREADQVTFRGAQYDHGLAWVHFPEGKGGLGLSSARQKLVNDRLVDAGVTYHDLLINPIGIGMGAPVVLTHGTDEMHHRFLRRIFTGEDIWCQLFSEPTAGSDVATLATKAERDGDEWIINGQKVWTTLAHVSNWGMLLARTDPGQPKHKGMTYFVVDMNGPGVETRPLYQITGEAEFNEVFFTDARIPDEMRLSDPGEGWSVAITTLMNERVALGGGEPAKGSGAIAGLVGEWEKQREALDPATRAVVRDRVIDLWIRAEAARLTNIRAKANAKAGVPGPEGSVGKLISAELNKAITECLVDVLGPEGMLHPVGYPMARSGEGRSLGYSHSKSFLRARANSIEGGTSEIMRNILGERVLGLPGEPRVDKSVAWSDVPK